MSKRMSKIGEKSSSKSKESSDLLGRGVKMTTVKADKKLCPKISVY